MYLAAPAEKDGEGACTAPAAGPGAHRTRSVRLYAGWEVVGEKSLFPVIVGWYPPARMTPLQPIYFSQFGAQSCHLVLGVRRDNLLRGGGGGACREWRVFSLPRSPLLPKRKKSLNGPDNLSQGVCAQGPRGEDTQNADP